MSEAAGNNTREKMAERIYEAAWMSYKVARFCCEAIADVREYSRSKRNLNKTKIAYNQRAKGYLSDVEVMFVDDELDAWRLKETPSEIY